MDRLARGLPHLPPIPWQKGPTEMISGDGWFNEKGLEDFMKLRDGSVPYAVIAIMGPQSSGKSTLLNHLFQTKFKVMDELKGRSQTTKGIWIARARNMDPFSIVMDVEGTDSQERGEDGTTFEKQSALLALAVADILVINMRCQDIGLENAANRPLLKTIFEEMMHIFSSPRKRTLHFVIRDKTKTPIQNLETRVRNDVHQIWERVPKTEDFKDTPLSDYFNVEVNALPHYDFEMEKFKEEVFQLKERILDSITVAGDGGFVVPASGFCLYVKELWETIKQNKNLHLPTHKKMVATVRCEEIATQKLTLFTSDEEWLKVEAAAKKGLVSGFSEKISSILNRYFSEYDSESKYFEEGGRNAKRQHLRSEAFKAVYPACMDTLGHLRSEVLMKFETRLEELLSKGEGYTESVRACSQSCEIEFDQRCSEVVVEQAEMGASFVRKELVGDMKNHALLVRTNKLPQVVEQRRERLAAKISAHLNRLFKKLDREDLSWSWIRRFLKSETESAALALRSEVAAFGLEEATLEKMVHDLKLYARKLVEDIFKREAEFVMDRMMTRFIDCLSTKEDPYRKCLKLLSVMAAIRLEENSRDDDEVENLLVSALINGGDEKFSGDDPLASHTWEELNTQIPSEMTLITPLGCKDIWLQFKKYIETASSQIKSAEDKEFKSLPYFTKNKSLPYWTRLGAWLLGVKRFMLYLWERRFELAVPLFCELTGEGIKLAEDGSDEVINGCKRMNARYRKIMRELEEAVKIFHDFMDGIISLISVLEVGSQV